MIATTLHLLACIALVASSLYWRYHATEGASIYRHVMPYIIAAGFLGLLILYGYFMEFFVASYSGAIYAVGELPRGQIAWIAISISGFLTILPLVGLIPAIGRQGVLLLVVACLAAVPSVVSLVSYRSNHQAEQAGSYDGG
jgi:hypothetical protein